MARSLDADFAPALAELRALFGDVDVAQALDELAEAGLPLLVAEVDHLATKATGDLVFAYHLSDGLEVHLTAVRARKLKAMNEGVNQGNSSKSP